LIPIGDLNPSRNPPVITTLLIIACFLIFLYEIALPPNLRELLALKFGLIPFEITHGIDIPPPAPLTPYGNLVSYQYLHGSLMHIFGNMLFLWIFGDNVEDKLGKVRFFIFYTLCGISAALLHALVYPDSKVPLIGASGAISGVLGAYAVLFPRAQIITMVFFFFFVDVVAVPAIVWIAAWFTAQFVSAMLSATHMAMGGIAWFAHIIGGFITGMVLVRLMRAK